MRARHAFRYTTKSMIAWALIVMTIVPCSCFVYWQYRSDDAALLNARTTHQMDVLNLLRNNVQPIVNVARIAEQQVLEAVVVSNMFSGYLSMSPKERLYVLRQVNAALTSIRHANPAVENIYLIGVENNCFTTNYYCDEKLLYQQDYLPRMSESHGGVKSVIPTRKAEYCYRYKQYISPYVVSFVVHLNQNMREQAISFSQVDIDYAYLKQAMQEMDEADGGFACILDEEDRIIYAPWEEYLGQDAKTLTREGLDLAAVVERSRTEDVFALENFTVRTAALEDVPWRIVTVNGEHTRVRQAAALRRNFALTMLALAGLSALLSSLIARGIVHPMHRVMRRMEKVSAGDFSARAPALNNTDFNSLSDSFNRMIERVTELMHENERKERDRITMEMTAKQSQINSHFLYNTLNTIKWMALERGQEEIADVVVALVNLLEYSARDRERFVPVSQELSFIADYLKVQEVRTSCRVKVCYDLAPEVYDCVMLKMLLQPAVENAILHGFREDGEHLLQIGGCVLDGTLRFVVEDNGTGFEYHGLEHLSGMGLNNVAQRIRLHYGDAYGVEVASTVGQGTRVTISFPAQTEG